MYRVIVCGVVWGVVSAVGIGEAADQKQKGNQPRGASVQPANQASSQPSQASNTPGFAPGGGVRYLPPNRGASDPNSRAALAAEARATAAFRSGAPNRGAVSPPNTQSRADTPRRNYYFPGYPYGGGYYNPYGYYPYAPYGTTPYVLAYDPYTGQGVLYPYGSGYVPYGYSSYGYAPFAYRYSYYGNPYLGFGHPSTIFADPNQLFGLGINQGQLGAAPGLAPQQNAAPFANANPNPAANDNQADNNPNPGFANGNNPRGKPASDRPEAPPRKAAAGAKAMELAWKFITFGDARFGELKYNEALDRYRRASRECPTLGDAWFREGFALAAMGKYDQAAKAMRRGLDEKPDWPDTSFRLDDIYGDNVANKRAVVNGIVKAAEAEPTNGDVALVIGIHLFCDGKADQAAAFFRRAAQIQGSDVYSKPFLDKGQQ